jgi:DNA-3-methyladenine glycosylase I
LRKRARYREVFDNFEIARVARYGSRKVASLLADEGIVRNRLKIASAIQNAKAALTVAKEFGSLDAYLWRFVEGTPIVSARRRIEDVPALMPLSDRISKDLRARGFSFVGSTIVYAFMQATGMVNDHLVSCFRYRELTRKRR